MNFPYEANTDGIVVRVNPCFMPDASDLGRHRFLWEYNIEIENLSDSVWKLTRRHWRIITSNGHVQTVDGDGVVGQMPVLEPGETYRYTSGVPLNAPSGMMGGKYEFECAGKPNLLAEIPTFSLDSPHETSKPS